MNLLKLCALYLKKIKSARTTVYALQKSLNSLSNFWSGRGYLPQQTFQRLILLYVRQLDTRIIPFAGVRRNPNCKVFDSYDIVTKKNVSISSRDVLSVVCYYETCCTLIVANCKNALNNFFAACYV